MGVAMPTLKCTTPLHAIGTVVIAANKLVMINMLTSNAGILPIHMIAKIMTLPQRKQLLLQRQQLLLQPHLQQGQQLQRRLQEQ
jgi:hypothetical protein